MLEAVSMVRVLQRNRSNGRYVDRKRLDRQTRRFLMGIDSHNSGDEESEIGQLKARELENLVAWPSLSPRVLGCGGLLGQILENEGWRTWIPDTQGQKVHDPAPKGRESLPFPCHFALSKPSMGWRMPVHARKV